MFLVLYVLFQLKDPIERKIFIFPGQQLPATNKDYLAIKAPLSHFENGAVHVCLFESDCCAPCVRVRTNFVPIPCAPKNCMEPHLGVFTLLH